MESESDDVRLGDLEKELEDLNDEEKRLIEELDALQEEEKVTVEAIEEKDKERERLVQEENRYWAEYTKHKRDYMLTDEESKSIDLQLQYTQSQLEKLKKTNVFNVTFHIWHAGHFGTINNFRLGRLPAAPVDWSEINAAWGQTVLLLTALARKIDLTFERYKLIPYGNHSYIEVSLNVYFEHRTIKIQLAE